MLEDGERVSAKYIELLYRVAIGLVLRTVYIVNKDSSSKVSIRFVTPYYDASAKSSLEDVPYFSEYICNVPRRLDRTDPAMHSLLERNAKKMDHTASSHFSHDTTAA